MAIKVSEKHWIFYLFTSYSIKNQYFLCCSG